MYPIAYGVTLSSAWADAEANAIYGSAFQGIDHHPNAATFINREDNHMTKTLPGGEFGSAWASLAAASRGRPNVGTSGFGGEYRDYTTRELIGNAFDCRGAGDDATADKLEAEIARRQTKKGRRR